MLMAAFGGLAGNLPALDAMLAEIDRKGIHSIVNVGNSVVGYPWPNEVLNCLQSRRIHNVQGSVDRLTVRVRRKAESLKDRLEPSLREAVQWTNKVMISRNLEYLGSLPRRNIVVIEGLSVCLCHGTPSNQSKRLGADDDLCRFRRQREYINVDIVVMGGGREPFWRMVDGTLFVNPGCAGLGEGPDPTATFAMVSTEDDPWAVSFNFVPYDFRSLGNRLAEVGLEKPWAVPV